ncbi:MAG: cation:proton antiporter, partial [Caulobacteraceae bacterium]
MAAGGVEPQTYSNLTAFLVAAGVVVPLFRRFRISPIPGFLAAGLLLGPYGLGRFVEAVPWLDYFTIS